MLMDRFTEAIAHFIGLFQTSTDHLRLRKDYAEFEAERAAAAAQPELPVVPVNLKAPHEFAGMDPGLNYQPVPPDVEWLAPWSFVDFKPPSIPGSPGPFNDIVGGLREGSGLMIFRSSICISN